MRKLIGWLCALTILALITIGAVQPTLGAGASWPVQVGALLTYLALFTGAIWGFLDD